MQVAQNTISCTRDNKTSEGVTTGLSFQGVKGKADLKKRLDLEIKVVNKGIGQNA